MGDLAAPPRLNVPRRRHSGEESSAIDDFPGSLAHRDHLADPDKLVQPGDPPGSYQRLSGEHLPIDWGVIDDPSGSSERFSREELPVTRGCDADSPGSFLDLSRYPA